VRKRQERYREGRDQKRKKKERKCDRSFVQECVSLEREKENNDTEGLSTVIQSGRSGEGSGGQTNVIFVAKGGRKGEKRKVTGKKPYPFFA